MMHDPNRAVIHFAILLPSTTCVSSLPSSAELVYAITTAIL